MAEKRILIVDDDPDDLTTMDLILRTEKYKTMTAATGRAAVQKASMFRPDLVILDLHMPVVDGFHVLSQLQRGFATLPVLVVTGDRSDQAQQRAEELGASGFLVKPLETAALISEVRRLLHEPESLAE
jgi:CheY-like chemotaxis protein